MKRLGQPNSVARHHGEVCVLTVRGKRKTRVCQKRLKDLEKVVRRTTSDFVSRCRILRVHFIFRRREKTLMTTADVATIWAMTLPRHHTVARVHMSSEQNSRELNVMVKYYSEY